MASRVVLMVGVGDATATVTGLMDEATTGVSGRAGSSVNMTSTSSEIAPMGYVVVSELGTFTTADPPTPDAGDQDDGCDSSGDPIDLNIDDRNVTGSVGARFATWAILQDVGEGSFFGTEIPTATVATNETLQFRDQDRIHIGESGCGREENCRGLIKTQGSTQPDKVVTVRFDNNMENMSESMVYVWMDNHMGYQEGTGIRMPRPVTAMVYCEGAAGANRVTLDLPDRINVVDGMDLGCDGRGVAMITLPDFNPDSSRTPRGAVVWSHISQMDGGFRMKFAGYAD